MNIQPSAELAHISSLERTWAIGKADIDILKDTTKTLGDLNGCEDLLAMEIIPEQRQ
jgi:hypothetical protein